MFTACDIAVKKIGKSLSRRRKKRVFFLCGGRRLRGSEDAKKRASARIRHAKLASLRRAIHTQLFTSTRACSPVPLFISRLHESAVYRWAALFVAVQFDSANFDREKLDVRTCHWITPHCRNELLNTKQVSAVSQRLV